MMNSKIQCAIQFFINFKFSTRRTINKIKYKPQTWIKYLYDMFSGF